jgi:hypothetical protein
MALNRRNEMEREKTIPVEKGCVLLWTGILGGPIAWLIQFQLRYSLVPWACANHKRFVLHLVTVAFVLLILAGAYFSWRIWDQNGKTWPNDKQEGVKMRNLFLAGLGMLSSALFALLTLVQGIPPFFIDPCEH